MFKAFRFCGNKFNKIMYIILYREFGHLQGESSVHVGFHLLQNKKSNTWSGRLLVRSL